MNKERRKTIDEIAADLDRIKGEVESCREQIEAVKDEEQEFFDNMPESFQNGEKGERAQAAIDALDTAASELEGFDFDSVANSLAEAAE